MTMMKLRQQSNVDGDGDDSYGGDSDGNSNDDGDGDGSSDGDGNCDGDGNGDDAAAKVANNVDNVDDDNGGIRGQQ
jgi:hypothetical protein